MDEQTLDSELNSAIDAFLDELLSASDRAAVLVGGAVIDDLVERILLKVMLENPTRSDDLFEGDAPLATFSARISLAHRLRLIDARFARALHLLRKVRNSFAHEVAGCALDQGSHRDRVYELCEPFRENETFKGLCCKFGKLHSVASINFRASIIYLFIRLHVAIATAGLTSTYTCELVMP